MNNAYDSPLQIAWHMKNPLVAPKCGVPDFLCLPAADAAPASTLMRGLAL